MALRLPNLSLGTAGHIDHGKTALIKFLTGCDTDRLKAEKERGMTIELGFAPATIGDQVVGIVDVPGHEHFIKTMVAGASAIDGVIFVVAADDGIMPQTREHLDILTLLGIEHGVVALTKIDRVDEARLARVRDDLRVFLQSTFLAEAPVLPVCNLTGDGFGEFYNALVALVASIRPKRTDGVFRLPVERAFAIKGTGTVVSGIPVAGAASVGDEVVLLPEDDAGRVRAIEVYGREAETVLAGQCAALSVRQWDHRTVGRGHTVVAPGYFTAQEWFVCRVRLLSHETLRIKNGARLRFHTGTSETNAALYLFDGEEMRAGEEALAQLHVAAQLVAAPGDRFILRSLSPVNTIGGGVIVEGFPFRLKRSRVDLDDLAARAEVVTDQMAFIEYCLGAPETVVADAPSLAQRVKVTPRRLADILGELVVAGRAVELSPTTYAHPRVLESTEARLLALVEAYHHEAPASPGITPDNLQERSRLAAEALNLLTKRLLAQGRLALRNQRFALPQHQAQFAGADQSLAEHIETLFREQAFHPPSRNELVQALAAPPDAVDRVLALLRERGRLTLVAPDMLFHSEAVARAREIVVEEIRREGKFESVRMKYLLDTTRKFALPLLDYFDRIGVTRRVGNTRYLPIRGPGAGR